MWIGPEDPSQPVLLVEAIDFEVAQDSEPGHLVVSKLDDKGRLQAVNSVELTLLSQGKANLMPVPALYQKIIIEQPARFAEISDAFVTVTGLAHTSLSQPLKAQLVTEDGGVVGQRLSVSAVSNGNDYVAFSIQIPYQVNQRTPVRLIIFVDDLSVSIVTYLASQELWLNPLR